MTVAAERALMAKWRKGEIITPEDHITTIDDLDELAAFKAKLTEVGRMTQDTLVAIYRREKQIGRSTHG